MRVIHTIQAMKHERAQLHGSVGFVPTMGFLHAGHLSLFQQARTENDALIASIFVNPTQFGANEDFTRYPRNTERDLQMLEELGVDVVFLPTAQEMYPTNFTTYVTVEGPLSTESEGAIRPGHFRGVATVVQKLFHIVQPQTAYFGQKDAQQVAVITRMVEDMNLPITLRILPTVREKDGLAMSSRNSYLTEPALAIANTVYQALKAGQFAFDAHMDNHPDTVTQAVREILATQPTLQIDYVEVRDAISFEKLEKLQAPALLLVAVRSGSTRLIDNFLLRADYTWDTGIFISNQHNTIQL